MNENYERRRDQKCVCVAVGSRVVGVALILVHAIESTIYSYAESYRECTTPSPHRRSLVFGKIGLF